MVDYHIYRRKVLFALKSLDDIRGLVDNTDIVLGGKARSEGELGMIMLILVDIWGLKGFCGRF